jgi:hypothetical protein
MAAMLLFRPQGLTGGREFSLAFAPRLRAVVNRRRPGAAGTPP